MIKWLDEWFKPQYKDLKEKDTEFLLDYFKDNPPMRILDIGCGLAWESRAMQQHYGSELWLLEGNKSGNTEKSEIGWRGNRAYMDFYHTLDQLDQQLQKLGAKNYHLIDADNIQIDNDVKFDLVYSAISCGFHYDANTYMDLITEHSHQDTVIIFDVRTKKMNQDNIEIQEVLMNGRKHKKCLIKFLNLNNPL